MELGSSLFCKLCRMRCLAFCLGHTVVLYISLMLYIAFWAIAACPWSAPPTLSKLLSVLCQFAGGFILAFCLMKANSCNMQELLPLNKITVRVPFVHVPNVSYIDMLAYKSRGKPLTTGTASTMNVQWDCIQASPNRTQSAIVLYQDTSHQNPPYFI